MAIALRIQNSYGDFLRSFKTFLDRVTRNSLNKISWNYASKPIEYYTMMNGEESFEFPVALVEILDIQPVDGVGPIARNAAMEVMRSMHQLVIAENATKNQRLTLDKRWVNLSFNVTINTEDVTSLLNYHDLFITTMPLNFFFYDYKYWSYIDITPFANQWDFVNDDISNVSVRLDPTYRYPADDQYQSAIDPGFTSTDRDRVQAGDTFPVQEGERYFSDVLSEPIIKLTSIQKQTEKENNMHSLILNFEAQIEIPNLLVWTQDYDVESIELVIDVTNQYPDNPILIDIPENFLTNKNIQRGVILLAEDFNFPEPVDPTDPTALEPYLEVRTYINLEVFTAALWAVEDVTTTSSKRFFIPLEHARVEYVEDTTGNIIATRFYFAEMQWFMAFNFESPLKYLKIILFDED